MTSTPSFSSTSTSLVCTARTPSSRPASPLFGGVLDRALEVVDDRQQARHQLLGGAGLLGLALLRRAAAVRVPLGMQAQELVLPLLRVSLGLLQARPLGGGVRLGLRPRALLGLLEPASGFGVFAPRRRRLPCWAALVLRSRPLALGVPNGIWVHLLPVGFGRTALGGCRFGSAWLITSLPCRHRRPRSRPRWCRRAEPPGAHRAA